MKLSKFLIVSLAVLAILTIGAVSASDELITDDLSVNLDDADIKESSINEDVVSAENNDDKLSKAADESIIGSSEITEEDVDITVEDSVVTDSSSKEYGKNPIVSLTVPKNTQGSFSIYTDNAKLFNKKLSQITKNVKVVKNKKTYRIYASDLSNTGKLKTGDILNFDFKYAGELFMWKQNKVTVKSKSISLKELRFSMLESDDWYDLTYGTSKKIPVFLKNDNDKFLSGKTVYLKFKGKIYKKTTNSKGAVYLKVPSKLVPKTYFFRATFKGDSTYSKYTNKIGFSVSKATPKLSASKKTFKAKANKKITATLKTNTGKVMKNKKVILKFNGKKLDKKTNSKGKVTFKVTKLLGKAGNYKVKIRFAGNKCFNAVNKIVRVTVK